MALDFARNRKAKGEHGMATWRNDGKWYVGRFGPGYSNTHEVTEFNEAGERWLLAHERKEPGNANPL